MPCHLLCYFSYLWQCLSDGRSDVHTRGSVCWMDTVTFIPVTMSVGWTQWHSSGIPSLTTKRESCRRQTPASQWLSWEIQVCIMIMGCSFLFQPAVPRHLQHSLECVSFLLKHLTLFLLFLSSDSHP